MSLKASCVSSARCLAASCACISGIYLISILRELQKGLSPIVRGYQTRTQHTKITQKKFEARLAKPMNKYLLLSTGLDWSYAIDFTAEAMIDKRAQSICCRPSFVRGQRFGDENNEATSLLSSAHLFMASSLHLWQGSYSSKQHCHCNCLPPWGWRMQTSSGCSLCSLQLPAAALLAAQSVGQLNKSARWRCGQFALNAPSLAPKTKMWNITSALHIYLPVLMSVIMQICALSWDTKAVIA